MQTIQIKFPAQRYHATPWDAHVNEGRVEWPPCPWRLLRALIAVGYNKLDWHDGVPELARSMVEKLSGVTPNFVLPKSTAAHTRHYMPYIEGKKEKKTKVFDTFLKLENDQGTMLVRYDVVLSEQERALLSELTLSLSYLGRAESWVDACLLDEDDEMVASIDGIPVAVAAPGDSSRIKLLAPMKSADFDNWRKQEVEETVQTAIEQAETQDEKLKPAKIKSLKKKAESVYPADIIDSLQQRNNQWQTDGWPRPPGSQWVDYHIPQGLFDRQPLMPLPIDRSFVRPTAILLSIDGEGKRGTLRPSMKRALPLMELLHSESVRYATRVLKHGHLPELTGTDSQGKPLQGDHAHAHWFPLSLQGLGKIDHVLVKANSGFSKEAVESISRIRWAYAKGQNRLSVNMVGQGELRAIYQQLLGVSSVAADAIAILKPSKVFQSATPVVLRKYLARHGKKTVDGQMREELKERGLPEPIRVEVMSSQRMVEQRLKGFALRRKFGKRKPPHETSWGIHLTFAETLESVPVSLGYASHFGLGLFKAIE